MLTQEELALLSPEERDAYITYMLNQQVPYGNIVPFDGVSTDLAREGKFVGDTYSRLADRMTGALAGGAGIDFAALEPEVEYIDLPGRNQLLAAAASPNTVSGIVAQTILSGGNASDAYNAVLDVISNQPNPDDPASVELYENVRNELVPTVVDQYTGEVRRGEAPDPEMARQRAEELYDAYITDPADYQRIEQIVTPEGRTVERGVIETPSAASQWFSNQLLPQPDEQYTPGYFLGDEWQQRADAFGQYGFEPGMLSDQLNNERLGEVPEVAAALTEAESQYEQDARRREAMTRAMMRRLIDERVPPDISDDGGSRWSNILKSLGMSGGRASASDSEGGRSRRSWVDEYNESMGQDGATFRGIASATDDDGRFGGFIERVADRVGSEVRGARGQAEGLVGRLPRTIRGNDPDADYANTVANRYRNNIRDEANSIYDRAYHNAMLNTITRRGGTLGDLGWTVSDPKEVPWKELALAYRNRDRTVRPSTPLQDAFLGRADVLSAGGYPWGR